MQRQSGRLIQRRDTLIWMLSSAAAVTSVSAASDAIDRYPDGPVRIIVPYPVAGMADVLARLVSVRLEKLLKQPITVENRIGANGTIGQQVVAQSKPDGYTLLLGNTGTQVVNRFLYTKLSFDIEKSFQPVGLIASTPMLLVVRGDSSMSSVDDLLKGARSSTTPLNIGSGGNGSAAHLALVQLSNATGINFTHVPYRGTSQIVPDLIGGRLTAYFDTPLTAAALIKAGKLKPLGIASLKRQPAFPNLPTVAETVPGFETLSWLGLFAPSGVPQGRIDTLNAALNTVLADPEVRRHLVESGNEVKPASAQAFETFIKVEAARVQKLVKDGNIRSDD
jgi:tripartite-type tricarboxylate transporter receptor subunit TctC